MTYYREKISAMNRNVVLKIDRGMLNKKRLNV